MNDPQKGKITLPSWMAVPGGTPAGKCTAKMGFLRRTVRNISRVFKNDLYSETYSAKAGLLQSITPQAKLAAFLCFLIFSGCTASLPALTVLATIPLFYAASCGIGIKSFFRRVWLTVPLVVLLFSLVGTSSLFLGGKPLFFLVPAGFPGLRDGIFLTAAGVAAALRIALRTGISISFAALLLMTTRWQQITGAFAALHLPQTIVAVLDMAYRYLFFLSESACEMFEARFLRTVGKVSASVGRRQTGGSAAMLFLKSRATGDEVYDAMRCRGYGGNFRRLRMPRMNRTDLIFLFVNAMLLLFLGLIR
jgi:cobalt/nickel transport system permease protein